jgi:hypothetical protein
MRAPPASGKLAVHGVWQTVEIDHDDALAWVPRKTNA